MSKISSEPGSPFAAALTPPAGAEGIRDALRGKHVCPFCGSVNDSDQGTCPRCTMENSAATRKATKTRIGPWYVLQTRNPAAPGMTWETLVGFVRKGRVKPRSIVRGPTTHQLWRFAAHVKGLSREFGICYSCGTTVEPAASVCPTCNRLQEPPPNPDALLENGREAMGVQVVTPPSGFGGAVPPTLVGTVVAEVPPPPPEDAEFVIAPLGAGGPTPDGAADGPGGFAGISGDTSWTRITSVPREPVATPAVGRENGAGREPAPRDPNGWRDRNAAGGPPQAGAANGTVGGAAAGGREFGGRPAGRGANGFAAAPPATARFNPSEDADDSAATTGGGGGGRRGEGDAGFLSPKELAAAFNLSFVGEDEDDAAPGYAAGRPGPAARGPAAAPAARGAVGLRNPPAQSGPARANAASPAVAAAAMAASFGGAAGGQPGAARQVARPPQYRPPRNFLKVAVAMLFLGGAGLGVALAVSADFRKLARDWIAKATAALNKPGEGDQMGSPGSTRSKAPKGPTPGMPADPALADDPDRARGDGGGMRAGATQPSAVVPPTDGSSAAAGAPVGGDTSASAAPKAAGGPTPADGPAAARPAAVPYKDWAESESYKLYVAAIRIEATDPTLAMAKYKSIQRQDPSTWPTDLKRRMTSLEERIRRMAPE